MEAEAIHANRRSPQQNSKPKSVGDETELAANVQINYLIPLCTPAPSSHTAKQKRVQEDPQGQNPDHIFTVKTPVCPAKEKQEGRLTVQSRNVSRDRNINMRLMSAGYSVQQGMYVCLSHYAAFFLRTASHMGDTCGTPSNARGVTSLWMFLLYA